MSTLSKYALLCRLLVLVWFWRYLTTGLIWQLSQSSIRPSIYVSSVVKSRSSPRRPFKFKVVNVRYLYIDYTWMCAIYISTVREYALFIFRLYVNVRYLYIDYYKWMCAIYISTISECALFIYRLYVNVRYLYIDYKWLCAIYISTIISECALFIYRL